MTDERSQPVRLVPRSGQHVRLSRSQTQIWTSQRLQPDRPVANMAYRIRIVGRVDPDRFVRAFDTVVRAADVLRMTVDADDSTSARVVTSPPSPTRIVEARPDDVDAWIADRIARPVDATGCVYDSVLLRHAHDDWTWWLDLHHVATDAASSALVFRATALAYEHDDGDVERLADAIDGRYFDAASADTGATPTANRSDAAGDASVAPAIAPYGRRGRRTTAVERLPVAVEPDRIDAALDGTYRSLSRDLGRLSLSAMTMALAIRRLDGRHSVVMGVPIHHRSSPRSRRVVGPLLELYPLEITVDDAETCREMFARVQRSIMSLLRAARPGGFTDDGFEIVLNVFSADYGDFAGFPTTVEWVRSGHVEPAHVVRSQMSVHGQSTNWELDVNTGLSADGAWRRLPAHVGAIAEHVLAHPDARCDDVDLVGPAELDELRSLDAVAPTAPTPGAVHAQIRQRLRSDPDRVVAEQDGTTVTAAEFDRRADDVAAWLIERGVGGGDAVGLRMRRSIEVLIAIHGVLRAGGAFVMLDPDDPPARHEHIAADAALRMIVEELPDPRGRRPAIDVDVDLDDIAYVLYTSGSTGAPKGVPISHRGLAEYLRFAADAYVDHAEPVVALHSALVFDLTITSLFLSFLTGGRTVVFPDEPVTALGRIARDDRITVLKATPSQLELFTRLAEPNRPLRSVVVGGEAFRRPVAERLRSVCAPGVRIFNEYGPTEAVVGCMIHEYEPDVDTEPDVPIGRAAPGCELRILDDTGRRTPIGSWGELYVRRDGMAGGYLHLPDLTAERFLDLDGDGRRWYRTGDRVRIERPGVSTYGGRMDDQLKVNGVRLEPSEVEAALVTHPDVDTALVRVWTPGMRSSGDVFRCTRCGLGSDVPGISFSVDGVCSTCHAYDEIEPQTRAWFKTEHDLDRRLAEVRAGHDGEIDCLHLLSGGKDSTYALYQLVERGWRVHALTLDNGFIADGAKENIRRSVADLGITHEFATTDVMNAIFRDSLDRYSNVCQGCYKTIYTIAVARARELGIPVVVTGLSRGQFFETRLVPHQFEQGRFDPDAIDRTVLEARRVYHRTPDAVTELLPEQRVFDDPDIFERVEFLDFYRYVDVDLADVYRFLEERAPWVRPSDTGRSTNCLINVAGIQVHRREQGYHNYAEPYSWDVRLGHKTRDEALEELDDAVDDREVERLLREIDYQPKTNEVLTAWYQARDGATPSPDELRAHLRALLPEHAVPSAFVQIDEVPLAASAKVDVAALPSPTRLHRRGDLRIEPTTTVETRLCEIWAEVLGLESVGVTDDFFDLGGASLAALEVVSAIDDEFDTNLDDAAVFRHRTIRELADVVGIATRSSGGDTLPTLDAAPLSAGEEAMLFEYRADPTSPRYNVTRLYTVVGDVDLDRLESAVRDVAMCHGPLHTSYAADRRALAPDAAVSFQRLPGTTGDAFARFAERQRAVPFDLADGPLVRVHAAVTGERELSLLIGLHHITIDAGTFDELWRQIAQRYAGGAPAELEHTYAEHGAWQRSRAAASAVYWAERSASRRPAAPLALRVPRPAVADGYVSRVTELRPEQLGAAGGTPFAASMAATAATMSLFAADRHVQFGITASSKDHPAAAPLVGYYLNTLPIDIAVDRGATFADLVAASGTIVSQHLPHRAYPFADMVRDARAAGHEIPDISVMLAFEALDDPELAGASVTQRILASGTAVADVSLIVQQRAESVEVGVEYRGAVVSESDAVRILDVFESVLVGGIRESSATIGDLVAHHLAGDLVGDELDQPVGLVLDRLLAVARTSPDAPAVVFGAEVLTYAELVARSRQVAARLLSDGRVRRVGVAIHRSAEVVVALIGAQLARAAYVPLDPTVGSTRLGQIVDQAGIDRLLVAGGGPTFELPSHQVVDIRDPGGAPVEGRDRHEIGPDDIAYVMFTSGSTGRPRGVEVTHANLAASTAARTAWYGHDPERFLLTSSIGFDSSIVGLFWTLATGGTIVMPDDDTVHDVDRLGDVVGERAVTHALMVPSLYRALLARRADRLTTLRVAIVAGEACPPAVIAEHEAALPATELVNEYGPTEATVWATAHRLTSADGWVPIGAPIPAARVRVADTGLRPLPPGVAGELLIAGPNVTRGYVDDPQATADRFVDVDGERWYRTGDLGRVRDGVVEFLGRRDDQLNVGGVRVEPAEVEDELRRWPGVREAVVVAVGDPAMLVAHIETDAPLDEPAVRSRLASALPPGSVPRRFPTWRELPRNPHGKVDRRACAALTVPHSPVDRTPGSAGGEIADTVLAAWAAAVGRDDIGLDTDFFDVGGDSLAAVEIVARLGDALGREVPIGTLLAAPTPRSLAAALAPADAAPTGAADPTTTTDAPDTGEFRVVTLQRGAPDGAVVVMTPAWDDVFGYQALARSFPDDVTVLALAYHEVAGRPLVTTVDELVTGSIDAVRGAVAGRSPLVVLGWSVGGVVAVELAERLRRTGERVELVAAVDTFFPGEHRHLWSNRWWKYKSMLRPGAFGAAAREFGVMAGRRVRRLVRKLGRRLMVWSGADVPDEPERTSVGGFPTAALDHPITSIGTPMVVYAAATTNPRRTVEHWRRVADELVVVTIDGRHRGLDSVMAEDRVAAISDDLMARL